MQSPSNKDPHIQSFANYCRLGCVCSSLTTGSAHCGHVEDFGQGQRVIMLSVILETHGFGGVESTPHGVQNGGSVASGYICVRTYDSVLVQHYVRANNVLFCVGWECPVHTNRKENHGINMIIGIAHQLNLRMSSHHLCQGQSL